MAIPRTSFRMVMKGPETIAGSIPIELQASGMTTPLQAATVIAHIMETLMSIPGEGSPFMTAPATPQRRLHTNPTMTPTPTSLSRWLNSLYLFASPRANPRP